MSEKNEKPFIIRYKNETYDISRFILKHPGGLGTLKGLSNTDIDERFKMAPPHSQSAMYLLNDYKVSENLMNGTHKEVDSDGEDENGTVIVNAKPNGVKKPNGVRKANGLKEENGVVSETVFNEWDDSLEHLVDWSKPMLWQIPSLGENYNAWINKPLDRYLRLFGPWYMEILSRAPWYLIPIIWVPIITYLIHLGSIAADVNQCTVSSTKSI